jgi:thiol-disulfide isomerase/thioredoxin
MGSLFKLLLFSFFPILAHAQQGKIIQRSVEQKTDTPLQFLYTPPTGLQIPEGARIKVFYLPYKLIKVPIEKEDQSFYFILSLPDTTSVFIAILIDSKNKVVDDNAGRGYTVEINKNLPNAIAAKNLAPIQLKFLSNDWLGLNFSREDIVRAFEQVYELHPELKKDESFFDYARLKIKEAPAEGEKMLMDFAKQYEYSEREQPMFHAMISYNIVGMEEASKALMERIIKKFPKGDLAKGEFNGRLYELEPKTEESILELMKEYENIFQDSTHDYKNAFYLQIIKLQLEAQHWEKLEFYEKMLPDPIRAVHFYNDMAWELSGGDLTSQGKELLKAERLGAKALSIISNAINNPTPADDIESLERGINNVKDTYALILYKLGRYTEAFAQQHYVDSLGGLDAGGKERMAAYADKAKGAEYARTYIEKTLAEGTYSVLLLKQLEQLYRQLNLPMDDYAVIKQKTDSLGKARAKEAIIILYGTENAVDFTLPDAAGKEVSLAGLRGKMVVLDFWATWCGPCLASFPKMQEMVEKYDGDRAAFLFINTWENSKPEVTREKVDKLLKEKKYGFHVLFDYKDDVVKKYKIEGIPTKIVIDKEGKIISIDSSEDSLVALIEGGTGN